MIMSKPEIYGDAVAAELCLEHASLNPASVTLLETAHGEFWPEDWRAGKRPTDFAEQKSLRTIACPGRSK